MSQSSEFIGYVSGRLTVIEGPEYRLSGKRKIPYWRAKCSCGSDPKWYQKGALKYGTTSSCGCLRGDNLFEVIYDPTGSYVLIELLQGQWATCNIEDWFNDLINYKWCAFLPRNGSKYYVVAWDGTKSTKMHRKILKLTDSKIQVDHKDRDTLNNRRSNLRIASANQNQYNKGLIKRNTSGLIGVHLKENRDTWSYEIKYERQYIYRGKFKTKEEAAIARDLAALYIQKEFAVLNFPERTEEYRKTLERGSPF